MISHGYVQWAWRQHQLTATQKLVLLSIACQCDDHGRTHARRSTIAERCGIDPSGVSRHLKALADLRLIVRWDDSIALAPGDDESVQNRTEPVQNRTPGRAKSHEPSSSATASGSSGTPLKAPPQEKSGHEPEGFQTFWCSYPKKVSKGQALRTWKKLSRAGDLPSLDTLISAVKAQEKGGQLSGDKQFVPNASSWLNGERWLDEVVPRASEPADHGAYGTGYDPREDFR